MVTVMSSDWGALPVQRNIPWDNELGARYHVRLKEAGKAADLVFIVMNTGGVRKLLQNGVKLGADASVAAGPVGRTAEGATGALMQAEILTYSRSRGAFAGLSLEGQVIKHDGTANENLYGKKLEAKDILFGNLGVPSAGGALNSALAKYSPHGGQPFKN